MDLSLLKWPFPPANISWRVGSTTKDKKKGMALAYVDARDVMERLDGVCGLGCWQTRYSHAASTGWVCELGIKVNGEWVWKANGAGETQVEGTKGAASDAFKRAAVLWGVGRYLYDLDSPWVELDDYKRIAKGQTAQLNQQLNPSYQEHGRIAKQWLADAYDKDSLKAAWNDVCSVGYDVPQLQAFLEEKKQQLTKDQ